MAPGPSLTQQDCAAVWEWWLSGADRKVIAVNLAWRMAPWANYLFAGDSQFWSRAEYRKEIFSGFRGELWTAGQSAARNWQLRLMQTPLLSNSGANAISLAIRLGARWIGLLGFDYGPGGDGRLHFHPDHPAPLYNTGKFENVEIVRLARELEHDGIRVVNYSRQTTLECFERSELSGSACAPIRVSELPQTTDRSGRGT